MTIKDLPADLRRKMTELQRAMRKELPDKLGGEAREHFVDNFRRGGFVDNGLQRWDDVKRRDPNSPWYGFEYKGEKQDKSTKKGGKKKLNYSPTATQRGVLTSKRNLLMNSLQIDKRNAQVEIYTGAPHAQIHQEGGTFKVFGKHTAQMPARPFVGHSTELDARAEKIITDTINKIFG
ncbi:MAG: phage virion morphogenesis protein [Mucinivorans sp.]